MAGSGHKAQRSCLGCRQVFEQQRLVRYVLSPEGSVLVDYRHRLPGRGAYTCFERRCVEEAVKRRQFDRAFRRPVAVAAVSDLWAALGTQVRERILNLLGMARKSANVVSGSSMVLEMLGSVSGVAVVLLASDISAAIGEKIAAKSAVVGIPCYRLLDKERLGQLLGKSERSVVAIKAGLLAESVKAELARYENIVGES